MPEYRTMSHFLWQTLEIHETIAECMIFANHWVAKKIAEAFPQQALVSAVMLLS